MRFKWDSHLHRTCLAVAVGFASSLFGFAIGAMGIEDPAATILMIMFGLIFALACIGILA